MWRKKNLGKANKNSCIHKKIEVKMWKLTGSRLKCWFNFYTFMKNLIPVESIIIFGL